MIFCGSINQKINKMKELKIEKAFQSPYMYVIPCKTKFRIQLERQPETADDVSPIRMRPLQILKTTD